MKLDGIFISMQVDFCLNLHFEHFVGTWEGFSVSVFLNAIILPSICVLLETGRKRVL